jgi:predicted secreted acid phosphatase
MFVLRSITKKKSEQSNTIIGDHYALVMREENYEDFKDTFKRCFNSDHVADLDDKSDNYTKNCYGFIVTPNSIMPLYKGFYYYVMTAAGSTFANVSYVG